MSLTRSIHRQKQKEAKKQAEKHMGAMIKMLAMMPEVCNKCEAPFDKKDPVAMQDWQIEVSETEDMKITCLECRVVEVENEI